MGVKFKSVIVCVDSIIVHYVIQFKVCGVLVNKVGDVVQVECHSFCKMGFFGIKILFVFELYIYFGEWFEMCEFFDSESCIEGILVCEVGDFNGDQEINVIDMMLMYDEIMGYSFDWWLAIMDD